MASSYTSRIRLEKPGTGEQSGTWGGTANTDFDLIDASFGLASITHDDTANYTLTANNGSSDEARAFIYKIGGTLTAARNAVVPTASKIFVVHNNTTGGYAVTVKTSGGSGVPVANGKKKILYCDGTDVVDAATVIGDAELEAIAALAVTDGNIIVGDGSTWVAESGATARTSLGAIGGALGATDNALLRADGTGGATAQGSAATLGDTGAMTISSTATALTLQRNDDGGFGPSLTFLHNSASPALNDIVFWFLAQGKDSAANTETYGQILGYIDDPTSGSEDFHWDFHTAVAGTLGNRLRIAAGVYTPNATSGDMGADTINASGLYMNGVRAGYAMSSETSLSGTTGTTFGSLPDSLNWIDVIIAGWSLDDTDYFLVRIGDSGGLHTSGYASASGASITSTAGFVVLPGNAAGDVSYGIMSLRRIPGTHTWVSGHSVGIVTDTCSVGGGQVTLDTALTQLAVLDTGGDNFDAGTISIHYG